MPSNPAQQTTPAEWLSWLKAVEGVAPHGRRQEWIALHLARIEKEIPMSEQQPTPETRAMIRSAADCIAAQRLCGPPWECKMAPCRCMADATRCVLEDAANV